MVRRFTGAKNGNDGVVKQAAEMNIPQITEHQMAETKHKMIESITNYLLGSAKAILKYKEKAPQIKGAVKTLRWMLNGRIYDARTIDDIETLNMEIIGAVDTISTSVNNNNLDEFYLELFGAEEGIVKTEEKVKHECNCDETGCSGCEATPIEDTKKSEWLEGPETKPAEEDPSIDNNTNLSFVK